MTSQIKVDSVLESTSAAGVTVDGVLIKDGLVDGKDVSALSAGLTEYDQWNLTSNITSNTDPITSGFARPTGTLQTKLGTGMSHSSGIWTFPATGIYKVEAHWSLQNSSSASTWCDMDILFAQDGTNYNAMSRSVVSVPVAGQYSQPITTLIVDVFDNSW